MFSQIVGTKLGNQSLWHKLYFSPFSMFLLIYFIVSLLMNGGLTPFKRGFFCNDSTIQYPFKADTVSFKVLLVVAFLIPLIVIKIVEGTILKLIEDRFNRPRSKSAQFDAENSGQLAEEETLMNGPAEGIKRRLVTYEAESDLEACADEAIIRETYLKRGVSSTTEEGESRSGSNTSSDVIKFRSMLHHSHNKKTISDAQVFLFGLATTTFLSGIGKLAGGRLRPHFMERCRPNIDCTLANNSHRYIEDFACTNEALGSRGYSYITTSWPSGHAAIIFYSMLYLSIYLSTALPTLARLRAYNLSRSWYSPLLVNSIFVLLIALALYISLTRVSDYHHHPTDVMSGIIIGIIVAVYIISTIDSPTLNSAS